MLLYTILIMIFTLIGWIMTLCNNFHKEFPYGLIGGILGVAIPLIILVTLNLNEPTAMDVYRGKTTLEITYKDGIPVDSVVVFKDKEK